MNPHTPTEHIFIRRLLFSLVSLAIRSVATVLMIGITLNPIGADPSADPAFAAPADPFQFIEAPVPMSNVSSTNWYGNTKFAYTQRAGAYIYTQGFHSGVDFLLPEGNPIRSTVNRTGKVISINNVQYGWGADPGNVAVDYGEYIVLYGHTLKTPPAGKQVKQVGEQVNFGDVIAYSGSDKQKQPLAHLHLEVIEKKGMKPCPDPKDPRPGCIRTNPVPFFPPAFTKRLKTVNRIGLLNFISGQTVVSG